MNSRRTSDYSPTKPGSREENQAINARRELIAILASPRNSHKGLGSISSSAKKMQNRAKYGRVTAKENIPNYNKAA